MCVLLAIRPYLLYADLRQLQLFTVRGRAHCWSFAVLVSKAVPEIRAHGIVRVVRMELRRVVLRL